jgi:hypothetical protein
MSTLDEITKEKQRVGRRSRTSLRSARSSPASSANWRRPSGCLRATAKARGQIGLPQPRCRPQRRRRPLQRDDAGPRLLRRQNQLAAGAPRRALAIRPWQPVKRSRKSPVHARGLARTMSASSLPGTSGLAASNRATESSMPQATGTEQRSAISQRNEKDRRPTPEGVAE